MLHHHPSENNRFQTDFAISTFLHASNNFYHTRMAMIKFRG